MTQITVTTRKELEEALKNKNVNKIRVEGPLAKEMRAKAKKKKIIGGSLIGASLIAAGSLVAAPFTGGTSLIAGAAGFTAALTAGAVTISTAELAIMVGAAVTSLAILKGYNSIKFNQDGTVSIEKN